MDLKSVDRVIDGRMIISFYKKGYNPFGREVTQGDRPDCAMVKT